MHVNVNVRLSTPTSLTMRVETTQVVDMTPLRTRHSLWFHLLCVLNFF
jgi:hypothetical protein